jgi:UDP-N-acetylmuramoylalanine--D-glutamate ligase
MPIVILGLGKVGLSLARYFHSQDEEVWGIDDDPKLVELRPELRQCTAKLFLGGLLPDFQNVSRFFISPGIDPRHPAAQAALKRGLTLEGELDLAFGLCRGDVLAITGTNGKSTTVSLLGVMYEAAKIPAGVGGNLGTPFIDLVRDPRHFQKYVVEVSSFQLETSQVFRPKVACLLNLSDDHFERHGNLQNYLKAKAKIFATQGPKDVAVYNDDDLHVLEAVEAAKARRLPFSISKRVHGVYAEEARICWAPEGKIESSFDLTHCKLKGLHNLENMSAAIACAKADGLVDSAIQQALNTFQGLPHRVEYVATIDGVEYYDDSKGTNVGAVVMSLAGFDKDVVLILGGRDKGGDYAPLRPLLKHKARALVVMGEAKDKIVESLKGSTEITTVSSMKEAVETAKRLAPKGGTVLLSPACSSFDMFKDYHDRGEQFKKCVREIAKDYGS